MGKIRDKEKTRKEFLMEFVKNFEQDELIQRIMDRIYQFFQDDIPDAIIFEEQEDLVNDLINIYEEYRTEET